MSCGGDVGGCCHVPEEELADVVARDNLGDHGRYDVPGGGPVTWPVTVRVDTARHHQ